MENKKGSGKWYDTQNHVQFLQVETDELSMADWRFPNHWSCFFGGEEIYFILERCIKLQTEPNQDWRKQAVICYKVYSQKRTIAKEKVKISKKQFETLFHQVLTDDKKWQGRLHVSVHERPPLG